MRTQVERVAHVPQGDWSEGPGDDGLPMALGRLLAAIGAASILVACQPSDPQPGAAPSASDEIDARSLHDRIATLASDEFEGRAPGSSGEARTVEYLTEAFRSVGLEPGNPDETYVQRVPLVGITSEATRPLTFRRAETAWAPVPGKDFVAGTRRVFDNVALEGEVVFVGYGVVAPEYDWDDFKGRDVRGKILLMLVNDPPAGDSFGGEAMTYYGRWTYKYEVAAELGAAGVFVIHETGPAGYPWEVLSGGWTGPGWRAQEDFDLVTPDRNAGRAAVEGWLHVDAARALFESAGLDFDEQKAAAARPTFQPVSLDTTGEMELANMLRTMESANVVAKLEGTEAPDEVVMYVAHWDHLGTDAEGEGDTVFNGAHDNASGTAGLLEIAEAFGRASERPRRSVVFLAVTAEERGLLGSRFYAERPLYPPAQTVAVVNMDGLNLLGVTRDVTVIGMGQSTLDDLASEVAATQGRELRSDPEPEKGYYYRSDHFEFAKVGIPAFYADAGIAFVGRPEGWGLEMRERYLAEDYHQPSDEVKDYWDLSGAVEDLDLLYRMGHRLATGSTWPEWKPTSEFRAIRDAQRAAP